MAIHWHPTPVPPVANVAVGDIAIHRPTGNQQRCTAVGPPHTWVPLQPGETRGDTVPGRPDEGAKDQVLVRGITADPYAMEWADPGPGLIYMEDFVNADMWECTHNLRNEFVTAIAVKSDGTIMIPRIEFVDDAMARLHFVEAVSGTAIIRR